MLLSSATVPAQVPPPGLLGHPAAVTCWSISYAPCCSLLRNRKQASVTRETPVLVSISRRMGRMMCCVEFSSLNLRGPEFFPGLASPQGPVEALCFSLLSASVWRNTSQVLYVGPAVTLCGIKNVSSQRPLLSESQLCAKDFVVLIVNANNNPAKLLPVYGDKTDKEIS